MSKLPYFGNLPFIATAADLTRLMKPHVEVLGARIGLDRRTYKSRGFGFVERPDHETRAVIAALHGTTFHGRQPRGDESAPHPASKDKYWKDKAAGTTKRSPTSRCSYPA